MSIYFTDNVNNRLNIILLVMCEEPLNHLLHAPFLRPVHLTVFHTQCCPRHTSTDYAFVCVRCLRIHKFAISFAENRHVVFQLQLDNTAVLQYGHGLD